MKKKLHHLPVASLLTGFPYLFPPFSHAAETEYLIGSSLKMIWGLLIVLGVLLIIYGFARRKLTFIQGGGKGSIRILETRHLMPKKTLFLVEVEGRHYLLGAGTETLTLLTPVEPSEQASSFNQILDQSRQENAV